MPARPANMRVHSFLNKILYHILESCAKNNQKAVTERGFIMPKKGMNIHKRNYGRWEGRYKIGKYPNGATRYASVYGRSHSEAKEKLVFAMAEKLQPTRRKKEPCFSDLLQLWLSNNRPKLKGATEHKYRTMIEKHIEPGLRTYKLSQLTSVASIHF